MATVRPLAAGPPTCSATSPNLNKDARIRRRPDKDEDPDRLKVGESAGASPPGKGAWQCRGRQPPETPAGAQNRRRGAGLAARGCECRHPPSHSGEPSSRPEIVRGLDQLSLGLDQTRSVAAAAAARGGGGGGDKRQRAAAGPGGPRAGAPEGAEAAGAARARGYDGALCRLRAAHPRPLSAERAGPRVAHQMCPVLRVQDQPLGEVLLARGQALLQKRLLQVRARSAALREGAGKRTGNPSQPPAPALSWERAGALCPPLPLCSPRAHAQAEEGGCCFSASPSAPRKSQGQRGRGGSLPPGCKPGHTASSPALGKARFSLEFRALEISPAEQDS